MVGESGQNWRERFSLIMSCRRTAFGALSGRQSAAPVEEGLFEWSSRVSEEIDESLRQRGVGGLACRSEAEAMEQGRPKFLLDAAGKGRKKRLGGLQSNEMDQALGQAGEIPASAPGWRPKA